MGSYGTARPATERDTLHSLNGAPVFLGSMVSSGTTVAVNNLTTATPFNSAGQGSNLVGTLAGKMLLLQPINAGLILPSTSSALSITAQTGATPGVLIGAGERVELLMLPTMGWLQWLSNSGSATLLVWELQ